MEGAVNNASQETRDQAREITPQRLLVKWSLAELSLVELSQQDMISGIRVVHFL